MAERPFARGSVSDLNTLYAQLRHFCQIFLRVKHQIDFRCRFFFKINLFSQKSKMRVIIKAYFNLSDCNFSDCNLKDCIHRSNYGRIINFNGYAKHIQHQKHRKSIWRFHRPSKERFNKRTSNPFVRGKHPGKHSLNRSWLPSGTHKPCRRLRKQDRPWRRSKNPFTFVGLFPGKKHNFNRKGIRRRKVNGNIHTCSCRTLAS